MYGYFAEIYDKLTANAQYEKRARFVMSIFEKYSHKPSLMLDLCCGTGSFAAEFIKYGTDVIGVDQSESMLSFAREKCKALFICQDARKLDLYGTVDGAVCMLDSINHITRKDDLLKIFKRVSLFLEKDKLFVFDINTPYKHKEVLSDNCFSYDTDEFFAVWQNQAVKNGTHIFIDVFKPNGEKYDRFSEDFFERAYTLDEITDLLKQSNFEVVKVLGDMKFSAPKADEERIYIVAKNKKPDNTI